MTLMLHPDRVIVPLDRPVIHVLRDETDNELYCNEFGKIDGWHPGQHCGHTRGGAARICVHRLCDMERTTLFGQEWVAQLHWWATMIAGRNPVIASRTGDVVSLMFDVIGPIKHGAYRCQGVGHDKPKHKFIYQLHRIQFWDEENPCDKMYLGVWPD